MALALNRKPAVAGTFYPSEPGILRTTLEDYLDRAGVNPARSGVRSLIVPHAGYIYSGPTAACAFSRIAECTPERVILLGCSHHYSFDGASIVTEGAFQTPLGDFPIDQDFAMRLAERVGNSDTTPHEKEHALEVELPFLAVTVGLVPIVPVLFGSRFGPWHDRFAEVLAGMTGDTDLVLASSDFSHYLTEDQANAIDRRTIDALLEQDVPGFAESVDSGRCSVCSLAAVATSMTYSLAQDASKWTLLDYRTSAHASGDTSRVVGYAALSMERA